MPTANVVLLPLVMAGAVSTFCAKAGDVLVLKFVSPL
jgi:hypothetical protein